MSRTCEMIVGFLIPHRCERPSLGRCVRCGRGYCEEHVQVQQAGLVCIACQQGLDRPVAMAATASTFDAADVAMFAAVTAEEEPGDTFSDLS